MSTATLVSLRIRMPVLLLTVALLGLTPATSASSATGPIVAVHPPSGPPGRIIAVTGRGFGPKEIVTLRFGSHDLGRTTTELDGSFRVRERVPPGAPPGERPLRADGATSALSAHTVFLVN